jgi:hypothetical protein
MGRPAHGTTAGSIPGDGAWRGRIPAGYIALLIHRQRTRRATTTAAIPLSVAKETAP